MSSINNTININQPSNQLYDEKKITKVTKEFASVFLSKMLHSMYEGVKPDPIFGGGSAEKIFRSMQIDEFSKIMSEADILQIEGNIKAMVMRMQNDE